MKTVSALFFAAGGLLFFREAALFAQEDPKDATTEIEKIKAPATPEEPKPKQEADVATPPAAAEEAKPGQPEGRTEDSVFEEAPGGEAPASASEESGLGETEGGEPSPEFDTAPGERWPYQEPLFALYAQPQRRVRMGAGFSLSPDQDSLAFVFEGAWTFSRIGVHIRMPAGFSIGEETGNVFSHGDLQFGAEALIAYEEETNKHLTVGLDVIAPLSRIGERKDLAGIQAGTVPDDSNFGKRYLLAQKPFLDIGLIPKLNLGLVPYVAFGQNLGRISLQTDFGCLILVMDNVSEKIYGTDRRYGFILFYDLAAPVAITQDLSLIAEFNATVALGGLVGTGFALTVGPRYRLDNISAGLGVQLPIGVDNNPPDDDKMVGRYDAAILARHQIAAVLDISYRF